MTNGNGTNGNGTNGVDLTGPLATMWRDVYRKAAGVAEARAQELLKYHVYTYPHGAGGGGGGGGGLVLVETQTMADSTATRVDFGTIPAAGAGLVLVVSAHQVVAGGSAGAGVLLLRLNDDASTNYSMKLHEVYGTTSPVSHQTLGDSASALQLGRLSFADDTTPDVATGATVALLPGHGVAGRRKQVLALGSAFTGKGSGAFHYLGDYGGEWLGTAPVTKLSLLPSGSGATFGAGSVFTLYQLSTAAGGGGGGAGDVTITTDASLVAVESPAETFTMSARISGDAGNALSLHANGLYASGGGGGAGNTTMYTQTATPTGATNSLWFNPSEAA